MTLERKPTPAVVESFQKAERLLLIGHYNPDGDALGSCTALARVLIGAGKSVEIFLPGTWSERMNFLLEGLNPVLEPADISDHDLTVLLDCHSMARLEDMGPPVSVRLAELASCPSMAVIDHHQLDEDEEVGSLWFLDWAASSTGELVWNLIKFMGWEVSPLTIQSLLVALVCDTGFFSQTNAGAATFRATADLLDRGGDLIDVNRRIKGNLPLEYLKLKGLILESLQLYFDGQVAVMFVTPEMLEKTGTIKADTDSIIEMGRSLAGVKLVALIKDYGGGGIRVSLRSSYPVEARLLALQFGGGGHQEASAYYDAQAKNVYEARENFLAKAESVL